MSEVRAHLQLVILFTVGLGIGIWTFVAPWALGYPGSDATGWSRPIWSNVIVGTVVTAASAAALVAALGLMARTKQRVGAEDRSDTDAT